MSINIAGLTPVDDPSYRYKMPRVMGKVEGRGNGIKTVLINVIDLGLALNREAPEITKFFGCELGSQTSYSADTERAIVNGAHIDNDLQKHLSKYIENFVLCKNCRLPETHYKIKDGLISQKCLACGSKDTVDMTHRLTAFILAQHKRAKQEKRDAEKIAEKADKKVKKSKDKDKDDSNHGDEETERKKEKKDKKEKREKKDKKDKDTPSKESKEGGTVFGFDGATEEHEEEEEESDSKAAEEAMERYKLWIELNQTSSTQDIVNELRVIQTTSSLRPADRIIIFLGAVFTEEFVTAGEIKKQRTILAALATSAIQHRHMIAAMEWLCGSKYPSLIKFFPVVLKQLLDEELVEEEAFFQWHGDLCRNEFSAEQSMMCMDTLEHLKESAAPFIKWLEEAEEEGESDDDEDEED